MSKSIINIFILFFNIQFALVPTLVFGQISLNEIKPESSRYLRLLYPRGTESFEMDEIINIEWESKNIQSIKIEYFQDDKWFTIIDDFPASLRNYKWTGRGEKIGPFKVRVSEYSNISAIFDISPFFLKIEDSNNQFEGESNQEIISSAIKIMPLGNSITLGYQLPLPPVYDGYRKPLKNILESQGLIFRFCRIKN